MSLIGSKIQFQKELYDTIYDSYMSQFSKDTDAGKYITIVDNEMKKAAQDFANKLSKGLADSIYKYILNAQVSITHAIIPGTVNTPVMGVPTPAVGAISILPTEVTIS